MCTLDETTGKVYLEDESVCAVICTLLGRRDWSLEAHNGYIPGDVMYIGNNTGRDSTKEFCGSAIRIDAELFSPDYESDMYASKVMRAGNHIFEARAIVRIPSSFPPTSQQFQANMHWLEALSQGLFYTYNGDKKCQERASIRTMKPLCPRLSQPGCPKDLAVALGLAGMNMRNPLNENLLSARNFDSLLGAGREVAFKCHSVKRATAAATVRGGVILYHRGNDDNQSNQVQIQFSRQESKAFDEASVKTVHLRGVIHPAFHRMNLANIASAATNPLYENAGEFTVWMTPIVPSGTALPGRYLQLPEGHILDNGSTPRRTEIHRAAVVLSLIGDVPIAGKMRVPIYGMINAREEKE